MLFQGEGMNTKTYEVLRIMRTRLRQTLLSKVPAEWIQFGKTCISAEPPLKEGQPVKLQFSDGSDAECDLLVAADGANSKLRNYLLPEEKTRYAGVTMLFVSPLYSLSLSLSLSDKRSACMLEPKERFLTSGKLTELGSKHPA